MFPDEPRLNVFLARDTIGPRFFHVLFSEFIAGSRLGDVQRAERAWLDIKEVLPVMNRQVQHRVRLVAPLIDQFPRGRFQSLARLLLRFAVGRKKNLKRLSKVQKYKSAGSINGH